MATFNVQLTSKATRSFSHLNERLVAAYRAVDPDTPAHAIKIITHHLHSSTGNWFYMGGTGESEMEHRYIRIIIDIPAGSKAAVQKEQLLKGALEACMDYEGKKAPECEMEVRVNEFDPRDVVRINKVVAK